MTTQPQTPDLSKPVIAQFIGRLVFKCNLRIDGEWVYLTNVTNLRYWEARSNGLGEVAKKGPIEGDKFDNWPDVTLPKHQLLSIMPADGWEE